MRDDNVIDGSTLKSVYYSLDEFATACDRRVDGIPNGRKNLNNRDTDWQGASFDDALKLARTGWEDQLAEALTVAESAVTTVEKEHEMQTFQAVWDVAGADVDMGRYLSGEPENMIDYPLAQISKRGKVITLCASISYSGSVKAEDIKRRGRVLCALALLLSRLGYSSELWISFGSKSPSGNGVRAECKVMVKGANDTLDPSRVMFAYAHPAILRALMFAWQHGMPSTFRRALHVPGSRGWPMAPIQDLPDGTIYLPEVLTARGAPNAAEDLKGLLREIGLIQE